MNRILLTLIALFGWLLIQTGCGDDDSNGAVASRDASLRALTASQGTLTPEFESGVTEYQLVVPNGTAKVFLTATAKLASYKSIKLKQDDASAVSLKSGKASPELTVPAVGTPSVVDIAVTAEDGQTTKHYQVQLAQAAALSHVASLSSLSASVGSFSPVFAPGTLEYDLVFPNGTAASTLTAVATNANAALSLNGAAAVKGSGSLEIAAPALGTTVTLSIVVTAEDGLSSSTYVVRVSQHAALSVDTTLSALLPSVGAFIPAFAPSKVSYQLRVPAGTTSIAVTPTATNAAATISVNGIAVPSGQSSAAILLPADGTSLRLTVVVTAEDPTKSATYTLTVTSQTATTGPTIYAIGDSTMADYDPGAYLVQRGWGQMFSSFIVDKNVTFKNRGINGRSSKSYYISNWDIIKGLLNAGDYVLIQFGHNDEKDNGIEGTSGVGTDAWGAYHDYLVRYVNETRALGAIPVLFTPVVRLSWNGTSLSNTACHNLTGNGTAVGNADYPAAMRDVATTLACPLVDMTASTKSLVEVYGATDAKALLYVSTDNTHLRIMGATEYARLAAEGLLGAGLFLNQLNAALGPVPSVKAVDFGARYLGSPLDRAVSISGVSLVPPSGELAVTAPAGFAVSLAAAGPFASTLQIPYTRAALTPTPLYIRFQPTAAAAYTASLTIGTGAIALTGTGIELPSGASEVVATYALDSATLAGACTTTGAIVCVEESFSGLYVKDYSSLTTLEPIPVSLATQRVSIINTTTADSWPVETDFNPARYVEFAVSPSAGKSLGIDTLSVHAGISGGPSIGMRIQYSRFADFANPVDMLNAPENATNILNFFAHSPAVVVGATETLRIRVFPYSQAAANSKYLALRGLTVHGVAY